MTGRTPEPADAARISAVLNLLADAEGGGWTTEGEIRTWLTLPGVPAENFRLFEVDGEPAGYADLDHRDEKVWLDLRIAPEHAAGELADGALAWAESRATSLRAPLVRAHVTQGSPVERALERRGYRTIRYSFGMAIELDPDPLPPELPAGIEVRTPRAGEERAVWEADMEAFADHWEFSRDPYERWLHLKTGAGHDPSLWFLAVDGDEIAGVCLCEVNDRLGAPGGWVDDIAVRRAWRRRGIGLALLRHAFREFLARGLDRAGLGVDGENTTGAVRLYERAGMHVVERTRIWERRVDLPGAG